VQIPTTRVLGGTFYTADFGGENPENLVEIFGVMKLQY
jgi:hypothetical protein